MPSIPHTENAAVLRTDFADEDAWKSICEAIMQPVVQTPPYEFRANVDFVNEPLFGGIGVQELLALIPKDYEHAFVFAVDQMTFSHPDRPILVIDLYAEPGRTFRVIPSEMWSIENNLSIANMDFAEFADAMDRDGIFRGFPGG